MKSKKRLLCPENDFKSLIRVLPKWVKSKKRLFCPEHDFKSLIPVLQIWVKRLLCPEMRLLKSFVG